MHFSTLFRYLSPHYEGFSTVTRGRENAHFIKREMLSKLLPVIKAFKFMILTYLMEKAGYSSIDFQPSVGLKIDKFTVWFGQETFLKHRIKRANSTRQNYNENKGLFTLRVCLCSFEFDDHVSTEVYCYFTCQEDFVSKSDITSLKKDLKENSCFKHVFTDFARSIEELKEQDWKKFLEGKGDLATQISNNKHTFRKHPRNVNNRGVNKTGMVLCVNIIVLEIAFFKKVTFDS